MRRRMGPRPMRCSSWLHSSILASGYTFCSLSTSSGSFFKSGLLSLVALLMLRTRHAGAVTQALQVVPAATRVHRAAQALLHPGGHFGAAPQAAISRWLI